MKGTGRRGVRLIALVLPACAAFAAALAGCASSPAISPSAVTQATTPPTAAATSPAASRVSLSETGSTLLYPLFTLWAPGYSREFPQVTVTTAGTGSGEGISLAASGAADIGASDAYLSPANVSQTPTLENIPLAISAQMVDYRLPGVTANLDLTGTVLAEMYSGQITMWNDPRVQSLNPQVPLPAIRVIPEHRSDSSGDTFLFTSYLSEQDPRWSSSISYNTTVAWPTVSGSLAVKGNTGMVSGCQAHPGCVAYIGISYKSAATAAGLGEARLWNGTGGYELPTAATVGAAASSFLSIPANGAISLINSKAPDAYPIINYEYAIVNSRQPDSTKARDIQSLLYWAITTGNEGKYLSRVNFQPLNPVALAVSRSLIAKIGSVS